MVNLKIALMIRLAVQKAIPKKKESKKSLIKIMKWSLH